MPSITSLITNLQADFPEFIFVPGDTFRWSPDTKTIYYDSSSSDQASLLHELSHGILGHSSYNRDIQLIEVERDAWEHTKSRLAPRYSVAIDENIVQDALDTYRDWLHARSTCPSCTATGLQTASNSYKCLACHQQWHVNDSRTTELRRYKVT